MINKTPSNLDHFPVPVAGQEIPRGWFARLVSFMNSLVLHGDNQYLAVKHGANGTTIAPTTKLIDALNRGGAAPSAGGGGSYGIAANVTGGTASVSLVPGGTASSFLVVPGTPNVQISGGSNGELVIGAVMSGGFQPPLYGDNNRIKVEDNTEYTSTNGGWIFGYIQWGASNVDYGDDFNISVSLWTPLLVSRTVVIRLIYQRSVLAQYVDFGGTITREFCFPDIRVPVMIPVPPGYHFKFQHGYSMGSGSITFDFNYLYYLENQ